MASQNFGQECKTESNKAPIAQTHTHEFLDSTEIAGPPQLLHNHRFAGVTSSVIPQGNSHVHQLLTNTDFFFNHFHEVGDTTGPAIDVGGGKHAHFVSGTTTLDAGHTHEFQFATLIENPLIPLPQLPVSWGSSFLLLSGETKEQCYLCRCGLSINFPYCTGAHQDKFHNEVRSK